MINWIKKRCPVCGRKYEYPENGGYMPKTCARFSCTQKYSHHPERYKSVMEHLDECRIKAEV